METITVALGERSYPIYIGAQLLDNAELLRKTITAEQVLIVTNDVVAPLYLEKLQRGIETSCEPLILPDGEQYKTLATFEKIIDKAVAERFHRDSCIVALGGGVVGDVAGFAAAAYQRGVEFIQVPTTLLAQVDSSVGGKTAVNHPAAKNMIGAFYQPSAVVADTSTLASLPHRHFVAGLAEVVKYGLIVDAEFFAWLEKAMPNLLSHDSSALTTAIRRCCEIKAAIVSEDELESGRRALLNLGHTFGHALEKLGGFDRWLHGEAVAIGMSLAARTSATLGSLDWTDCERIERLLESTGFALRIGDIDIDSMIATMQLDKKATQQGLKLILLDAIGSAAIVPSPEPRLLREVIAPLVSD